jgi:K+-sensing histidine kinase KdpD
MIMADGAVVRAWHRHVAGRDDPRLATSFAAGLGFAATLLAAAVMTHMRRQLSLTDDLGVFTALVALAGWWMSLVGALVTAVLAFLMLNGFAVDQYAVLRWHGQADVVRLVVLLGCAAVVGATREVQLWHRRRSSLSREFAQLTDAALAQGVQRHA